MKKLFFVFVVLFLATSCENSENYASIPDDDVLLQASKARGDIQEIVSEAVRGSEKKIGNKKRMQVNIEETVGGKDLGRREKRADTARSGNKERREEHREVHREVHIEEHIEEQQAHVTNIEITNVVVKADKEKGRKPTGEVEASSVKKKKPKLDILFYMDTRDSKCVSKFESAGKKGFLKHFVKWDWQLSFSYYTEESNLLALEYHNGMPHNVGEIFEPAHDYVLSAGEYPQDKMDRFFYTTLQLTRFLQKDSDRGNKSKHYTPDSNKYVNNPLEGLDRILTDKPEGFARSGSYVVILLFGDQFPYYSSTDWKKFFNKHKRVKIISVSSRTANISNFLHVLEKEDQFEALPFCSPSELGKKLNPKAL